MKILHIASGDFFSTYGGGQVYVKNVVDCMIANNHEVAVVSSVGGRSEILKKSYKGIDLYEIGSPDMLEDAIICAKPDVIHAHSLKHLVCRIGRKIGVPVVVTAHHGGILCPAGTRINCKDEICHCKVSYRNCLPCVLRNTRTGLELWYPLMRFLQEKTYNRIGDGLCRLPFIPFITPIGTASTCIRNKNGAWNEIAEKCTLMIAPCREIAAAMTQNGLKSEKIRVIPHGIPLPKERPAFLPVVGGKVKFYYVGRICYVKGIHILLEAFSTINRPEIELHLIGGASNKHEARYMSNLKKQYCLDKRIVWHDKISPEAVYEATRNYHVSTSATFLETFGLNIAEALALGKPVLATRSGGGEMQIKDGVNGWLVQTNDVETLSNRIEYIADHSDILPQMSKNCHSISIQEHCKNLFKIYSQCVSQ